MAASNPAPMVIIVLLSDFSASAASVFFLPESNWPRARAPVTETTAAVAMTHPFLSRGSSIKRVAIRAPGSAIAKRAAGIPISNLANSFPLNLGSHRTVIKTKKANAGSM